MPESSRSLWSVRPAPWRIACAALLVGLSAVVLFVTFGARPTQAPSAPANVDAARIPSAGAPAAADSSAPAASPPATPVTTNPVVPTPPFVAATASGPPVGPGPTVPAAARTQHSGQHSGGAPAAPPAPSAPAVAPAPPPFTPISVQAEAAGNTFIGGAAVTDCATCDGGARVRYVTDQNRLEMHLNVAVAGPRTIAVEFESDGSRTLRIAVNGTTVAQPTVTGASWTTPQTLHVSAAMPAGAVTLTFAGAVNGPDLDRVIIS
jgi:hypothetical protein